MHTLSATELAARIRTGDIHAREAIDHALGVIEARNPEVNAVVHLCPERPLPAGPLHGVPITVKDFIDVEGAPSTQGVGAMADVIAPADSIMVARLRAAGAAIVGKTNQPAFAMRWETDNDLFGRTSNPRDATRTCGGSSGGEAAAVAAGMSWIGLGSDTGGSTRVPAAACGVWGLRASEGRIARTKATPPVDPSPTLERFQSAGLLARSMADIALAFSIIGHSHPSDPASIPVQIDLPAGPKRVAVCGDGLDDEAAMLRDCGYETVETECPAAESGPQLWAALLTTDLACTVLPTAADMLDADCRRFIEDGASIHSLGDDVAAVTAAWKRRRAIATKTSVWMEEFALVLTPVFTGGVPEHGFDRSGFEAGFSKVRDVTWANLLGLPGLALPTGGQLIARRFWERDLLDAGLALEAAGLRCQVAL